MTHLISLIVALLYSTSFLLFLSDDLLVPFDDVVLPKPEPTRFAKEPAIPFIPPEAREPSDQGRASLTEETTPAADIETVENGQATNGG